MKPTTNRLMFIGRVLIVVTGFLLISWDTEAADVLEARQFFEGCSVSPALPVGSGYRIKGECLGYSFTHNYDITNERFASTESICRAAPMTLDGTPTWLVNFCVLDGRPASQAYFSIKTGKLFSIQYQVKKAEPTASVENKMVRKVQTSGRYRGCTISYPADNPFQRVITGKCAGHVFENPPIGGPHEEKHVCRLQELPGQMFIGDCIIDGRHRRGATTIADGDPNSQTQADAETLVKQRTEAPAKYPDLVTSARARSKADPVFLGIILGEQWNRQNVNDCSDRGWSTHNSIPFCSYPADEANTSHAGKSWTACVVIDKNSFDTSWIGSSSAIDYSKVQQYDGLAGLIVGMTALNIAVSDAEAEAKRESCKVYVSVLPDGTVGKVSTLTSTQSAEVETVLSLLIKKYGNQYSTNGGRRQWTLPGMTVSYLERVDGNSSVLGGLEISTAAVAREAQRSAKPAF